MTEYKLNDVFSLIQTFECGQCFRWESLGGERYRGAAMGRAVELEIENGVLRASCGQEEFDKIWRPYLDLDRDYASIRNLVSIDQGTAECVEYGAGIRILRQEPWETLCSFIISQCNNIPRIKGIISRLCAMYGNEIGEGIYSFPDAETIASLSEKDLAPLHCGYRAPYILSGARAVASGSIDLEKLKKTDTCQAKAELKKLPGIGEKVASCVLLFGLGKLDAFPVDVWMRRAIAAMYGNGFDPASAFGKYAGVAQQYIFFHERGTSSGKNRTVE